jgi:hypothetical protein
MYRWTCFRPFGTLSPSKKKRKKKKERDRLHVEPEAPSPFGMRQNHDKDATLIKPTKRDVAESIQELRKGKGNHSYRFMLDHT